MHIKEKTTKKKQFYLKTMVAKRRDQNETWYTKFQVMLRQI